MFSLQDATRSAAALDDKALRSMLERTHAWDGVTLDIALAWPDAGRCLAWEPAAIDEVTAGFAAVSQKLASGFPKTGRRTAAAPPAQRAWLRPAAMALPVCPGVEARCEVSGAKLADLISRDLQCRAVSMYAGRCKDGALDARLLVGSFGFYLISRILDGLRERARNGPTPALDRLLRSFAPMLVIIAEVQREQAERKGLVQGAAAKLQAELDAAQAERDQAEAALRLRRGQARPEDLRTLTEPPPTPPRKGRRTPR
jgi:hypothetical protein